jgi:hypothetical protein
MLAPLRATEALDGHRRHLVPQVVAAQVVAAQVVAAWGCELPQQAIDRLQVLFDAVGRHLAVAVDHVVKGRRDPVFGQADVGPTRQQRRES